MATLLVVPADPLDAYVTKGELKQRYFNPCNVFETVHVLHQSDLETCAPEARLMFGDADVKVHALGAVRFRDVRRGPLSRWRLRRAAAIAAAVEAHVVRAYDPVASGLAGLVAARASGIPLVVSVHANFDTDVRRSLLRRRRWRGFLLYVLTRIFVEPKVLRDARLVIAAYAFAAEYVRSMGREDVRVLYNRVDVARFTPASLQRPDSQLRAIVVGSAIPERGLDLVIDAVALAGCDLTLVGQGPLRSSLEGRVFTRGISDRVRFIDRVRNEDLAELYRSSDLYVSGMSLGGVSIPILEAAAAGLPIIGVRPLPHLLPEVIADVGVVTDRTAKDLAAGIRRLAADRELRMRLSARARAWALAHSDVEREEATMYRELLERSS